MKNKLRIGIALDTLEIPAWKNCLLDKLVADDFLVLKAVILPGEEKKSVEESFKLWKWHMKMDAQYFKPQPDAFRKVEGHSVFESIEKIEDNIKLLGSLSLDLILWLREDRPNPEVYEHLSIGVLYFDHGAEGSLREDFLGYEAFIKMAEVITSALMIQPSSESKAREIYRTWSMMPTLSISRSRNEHMWKLSSLVSRALKEVQTKGSKVFVNEIQKNRNPEAKDKFLPSDFRALVNIAKHFTRMGMKAARKLAFREQWILLLNMKQGHSTSFTTFKKILPPKDRFWADPFLVEKDEKQYLFVEELPFATDKGHLSVMEIDKQGRVSNPVKILDKPYHLSYPFIFKVEDIYYMIPESYEDKNIQLYECLDFPLRWEHKMNLMTGLDAFDTTLYFYNGQWWMFTLITEQKGGGHNDELFLFFADSPFTTDWKPHPKNPIVSDVRLARPAGNIYEENGKLIRPSQDCAKKYGYGFNLNEIEVLSEIEYREKRILNVRPDWDKSLTRTHSFNHLERMTVIDAVVQRRRFF